VEVIKFFFKLHSPSNRPWPWPYRLQEKRIPEYISGCKSRPASKADKLTANCMPIVLHKVRSLIFHQSIGLCGLKPRFISFIGVLRKRTIVTGKRKMRGLYKMGFVRGPNKLNNRSGKTISLGMIEVSLYLHIFPGIRYIQSHSHH
jgi:hypothetical protein